jgi:hypothetical protein
MSQMVRDITFCSIVVLGCIVMVPACSWVIANNMKNSVIKGIPFFYPCGMIIATLTP